MLVDVKNLFLILLLLVLLCGCQRGMPERTVWNGTLELDEGKLLPFRFSLDLRPAGPTGFFVVGEEQTPIPEISRNGDDLAFRFAQDGEEMRVNGDGRNWSVVFSHDENSGRRRP